MYRSVFLFFVGFYGSFAVCAQVLNLSGASFAWLYAAFAVAVAGGLLASRSAAELERLIDSSPILLPAVTLRPSALLQDRTRQIVLGVFGVLCSVGVIFQYRESDFLLFWISCVLLAAAAIVWSMRAGSANPVVLPRSIDQLGARQDNLWFLLVYGFMLGFYFLTSMPDGDESLFLNIAAGAKRSTEGLMVADTMLGVEGLDFIKSTYKIESHLVLSSLVSSVTGVETIYAAHAFVPVATILFFASSFAVLFSLLFGRHWHILLLVYLVILFVLAGHFKSYGNFGLTRIFQGKAVLVSVIVPLVYVVATLVVVQGNRIWLWVLGSLAISAVGFTANALYVVPLAIGLAIITAVVADGKLNVRRVLLALASIVYLVALGLYLLIFDPPAPSEFSTAGNIGTIFWNVLGRPWAHVLFLAVSLSIAGAAFLNSGLRYLSVFALAYFGFVLNPFLWDAYGSYVTGNVNFRLLWVLPFPFLLTSFFGIAWLSLHRPVARLLLFGSVIGSLFLPGSIFRETERFRWEPSLIKVHVPSYSIAREIRDITGRDRLVLAPPEIALWLPTFDDAPPVVEARPIYTPQRAHFMPPREYTLREELFAWISGNMPTLEISKALNETGVEIVVTADTHDAARALLEEDPAFNRLSSIASYDVYARSPSPSPSRGRRRRRRL